MHPPANERNPSPLIPLPIGWGEGKPATVHWHHASLSQSSDSSHVGGYSVRTATYLVRLGWAATLAKIRRRCSPLISATVVPGMKSLCQSSGRRAFWIHSQV